MSAALRIAAGALLPVGLILLWQASAAAGAAPHYLSTPAQVLAAFREMLGDGELRLHGASSLLRLSSGFALGALLGLLFGLAAGRIGAVRFALDPLVSFVNPIPKIAFLPIIILLLGIGHSSKIAIVALSVFFPVYLAAENGSRNVDQRLIWVARNAGAGALRIFAQVVLPATGPAILAGLRVGVALSFITLFAAELMGASDGLGQLIAIGEEYQRYDIMLACTFTFAAAGYLADRALLLAGRRLMRA